MKSAIGFVLSSIIVLLLAGCTYSNSEIYYATPIPGDSATVVVNTNFDTQDTVVISDSLLFKYSTEIEGGELYFISASISSLTLYQFALDYNPDTINGPYVVTDSFWIWSDIAADTAIYPLLFSTYYSSNTNSLGDKIGVEAKTLNLNFDLLLEGGNK